MGDTKDEEVKATPDDFPIVTDSEKFLKDAKHYFNRKYDEKSSTKMSMEDFRRVRTLGAGSFGRVLLAEHKKTCLYYAIKVMEKKKIVQKGQVKNTINEKKILQSVRFPFVMYLEFSFQDNSYVYLAMPFVVGGELYSHLRRMGKFPEAHAVFYAAQVVLSLEYLHYLDVLYRDLKPENILIDKSGYLKLADMGFTKLIKGRGRTWTFCGTPEYIAPEVILSKGYGTSADWWSFGILIFEMSAGYPPFTARDPMKIYEKIVAGKYKNADHFSAEVKDLIRNILQVDLSRRYGHLKNGVRDIKDHCWFRTTNWLALLNKQVKPPFVPRCTSNNDARNFDRYEEQPLVVSSKDYFAKEFANF